MRSHSEQSAAPRSSSGVLKNDLRASTLLLFVRERFYCVFYEVEDSYYFLGDFREGVFSSSSGLWFCLKLMVLGCEFRDLFDGDELTATASLIRASGDSERLLFPKLSIYIYVVDIEIV